MPKFDNDVNSLQDIESYDFRHEPSILKYLRTDEKYCDFQSDASALIPYDLKIHPLKSCDKSPLLRGWQAKATADPEQIEKWGLIHPTANVGIATGAPSGIMVLDFDLRDGARKTLLDLERKYGELPVSWDVLTPGGWHLYLKHPGGRIRNSRLGDGIDLRGDGGNLVGPGSIHPSGLSYKWRPFCQPEIIPLAEPPEWLLLLLEKQQKWIPEGGTLSNFSQVDLLGLSSKTSEGFGQRGTLEGRTVKVFFSQKWVIEKILPLLGLEGIEIGDKFKCVLHAEGRASASIMPPRRLGDPFLYIDFHMREDQKGYPLPFIYFRLMTGKSGEKVKRLNEPSFLVWSLRLLRDAGVLEGVNVEAPKLPKGVSDVTERVYEGFRDLLSLKWLVDGDEPSPYAWRFGQLWTGLPKNSVENAVRWLLSRGYLRFSRYFGDPDSGSRMMLFLLGTRRLVDRREGTVLLSGAQSEVVKAVEPDVAAVLEENGEKEAGKASPVGKLTSQLCEKCGEIWDWLQLGDFVACAECYSTINTS